MPDMIHVRPAEKGALVRNPDRKLRPLRAAGEAVPLTTFWQRRLSARDVVLMTEDEIKGASKAVAEIAAEAEKAEKAEKEQAAKQAQATEETESETHAAP